MATSLRLVVLLSAAFGAAVVAEDIETGFTRLIGEVEAKTLNNNIEKRDTRDQSVIYGVEGPYDRLLYQEFVNIPKGFFQVKKRDITFPPQSIQNALTITCIKILDTLKNGKNAEFKIGSGGVGEKFAIINMKSKRGEPIKYNVAIYGR